MKRIKYLVLLLVASSLVYADEEPLTCDISSSDVIIADYYEDTDISYYVSETYEDTNDTYYLSEPYDGVPYYESREGFYCPSKRKLSWFWSGEKRVFVEFLYWNPKEEGLDFALNTPGVLPPFAPDVTAFSVDSGSYRPGSRIGLEFAPRNCCINFGTNWTWYYSGVSQSTPSTPNTSQIPLLLNPSADPNIQATVGESVAHWNLHYNTIDAEVGYTIYPDSTLTFSLRPKFGVRAAWIRQNLNVQYINVIFGFTPTPVVTIDSLNENHFWGVGLHAGADLEWNFCHAWSFFCKAGGSLLSGKFNINQTSTLETPATFTTGTFPAGFLRNQDVTLNNNIVSAIDISSGVSWLIECRYPVELSLGWEFQVWFSQNQLHTVVDAINNFRFVTFRGDLSLQGIVARANVKF